MVERGRGLRLGPESSQEGHITGQGRVQHLHGHAPAQDHVVGQEDVRRCPATDRRHEAEPTAEDAADAVGETRRRHRGQGIREGCTTG